MASIIDSIKLILSDNNALFKINVFSLAPFLAHILYNYDSTPQTNSTIMILLIILFTSYLGTMLQTLNNAIEEKTYILPDLNIFKSFYIGLKGIISCGVYTIPIFLFHNYATTTLDLSLYNMKILATLGYLIFSSFLVTSIIFYSKKFKILEGLNPIKIIKNFHEVIVYLVIYAITAILLNLALSLPIGGLIYGLFGFTPLFDYTICIIITLNFLVLFQNLSQTYYEQIKD